MVVAARFPAVATQPIGRRGDCYHLVTAVGRSAGANPHRDRPRLPHPTWHRAERARSARDVVAGPHVGLQARSRSAAAGQDVGPGARAPGTGPLRRLELAAADLGAPAAALVETGGLHMLAGFAITRHGTSLLTAFREVEFLAEIFFEQWFCWVSSGLCRKLADFKKTCPLPVSDGD
jgi:hypothetical protein